MNELDFVERCGLDAYMFMDFLNKSFFLFIGFAILAIPILIPLNVINQLSLIGLNRLTIANIADQERLWGHLTLTVLFCRKCPSFCIFERDSLCAIRDEDNRAQHSILNRASSFFPRFTNFISPHELNINQKKWRRWRWASLA